MTERGATTDVLRWSGRVLSADDLRRHLRGQREVILNDKTLVTPLALDELKAKGVRLTRDNHAAESREKLRGGWCSAQEKDDAVVLAALRAIEQDGSALAPLALETKGPAAWAVGVADQLLAGKYQGAVAFCGDPALVCCVANKRLGIRAANVVSASQAAKALMTLGANLLAVEMPGRTFFEVRQILRTAAKSQPQCPADVAHLLAEVDHARR